jgi:hypothetical protein
LVTVVFLEEALDLEEVVEWALALRVVFLIRAAIGWTGRTSETSTRAIDEMIEKQKGCEISGAR